MTVEHVNETVTDASIQSNQFISHPINLSHAAIGELRIVIITNTAISTSPATAIIIPDGWTEINTNVSVGSSSAIRCTTFYRFKQGGDPNELVVNFHDYCGFTSICNTYSGVDPTNPIDVEETSYQEGRSGNPTARAVTTLTANAMVIRTLSKDGGLESSPIVPNGLTARGFIRQINPGNGDVTAWGEVIQETAGTTGTAQWNNVFFDDNLTQTFALRGTQTFGFDQTIFRFRNDDGSESEATWKGNENMNIVAEKDSNIRLRLAIMDTDVQEENPNTGFQLQYNLNDTGWNDVNADSNVIRSSATDHVTDGTDTTGQLHPSLQSPLHVMPITENNGFDDINGLVAGVTAIDFPSNSLLPGYVEIEFCFQVRSDDVVNGDTVRLRAIRSPVTALAVYTRMPVITVQTYRVNGIVRDLGLNGIRHFIGTTRCVLLKHDGAPKASRIYSIMDHTTVNSAGGYSFQRITDNDPFYMVIAYDEHGEAEDRRGVTNDNLIPVSEAA